MKRFAAREFLWLCAPIALVGAGFVALRLLHPPLDPDAVIVLTLTSAPNPRRAFISSQPTFDFEWKADARGGPQRNIQLLYAQKVIAIGNGHSQVIYQDPFSPKAPNAEGISQGYGGSFGPNMTVINPNMSVPYQALPLWTKRVEWRGDVVAVPQQSEANANTRSSSPANFASLARIKGAARATQTFPMRFDAKKLDPFQKLELGAVSPTDASKGADTCVTTQLRNLDRRVRARLIALDGTKKRQLWSNDNPADGNYWIMAQGSGDFNNDTWRDSQLFKLRDVPAQWGELIYIVDAVANPNANSISGDNQPVDAAEIARLQKAGWFYSSKRLTVRRAGDPIVAPGYDATPNTTYLSTQSSIYKTGWEIKVHLRYDGPKLQTGEELDSPGGPEFSGAKGRVAFAGLTYRIQPDVKPNEYLVFIVVPAKVLGKPRSVTLRMEIADSHAAPLRFETKLQVPKPPA